MSSPSQLAEGFSYGVLRFNPNLFEDNLAEIEEGDGILVRVYKDSGGLISAYPLIHDSDTPFRFYLYDKYGRYKGLSHGFGVSQYDDLNKFFHLWLKASNFTVDEVVLEDGENVGPDYMMDYYLPSASSLVGRSFVLADSSIVSTEVVDDQIYPIILSGYLLNLTKVGNQYRWGYVPWQNGVASVVDSSPISSIESELFDPQDIEGYIEQLGFQATHYDNMDGLFGYPILLTEV